MIETTEQPPLLSLRAAIQAGFELTSKKLWLLLFPMALDCFLWLGPRLSIRPVILALSQFLQETPQPTGTTNVETIASLERIGDIYNLFVQLSPSLLGVPILFNGAEFESTPIASNVIELDSFFYIFIFFVLFSIIGLLYSTAFFDMLVLSVQQSVDIPKQWVRRLPLNYVQMMALAAGLIAIFMIVGLPILVLTTVGALLSPIIAQIIFVFALFIIVSLMVYLMYTVHGIFFARQPIWRALYDSWRIVRANTQTTIWLIVLIMALSFLLDTIWLSLEQGTWFTIVPIFAHAFVQTSLFAASVYVYADRSSRLPVTDRPILT